MKEDYQAIFDYDLAAKEPVDRCNICQRAENVVTTQQGDRYGYLVGVGHCTHCDLLFLNPRMTPEAYTLFYQGPYRRYVSLFHNREINAETVEKDQEPYAVTLGNLLQPYLLRSTFNRLIDIGGSTGVVAGHIANRFHYHGTVVDLAEEELQRAAAKGLHTIRGTAEDFSRNDLYDLALVCQTIDHLLDPMRMLCKVRSLLVDTGLLFVDILDFDQTMTFKVDHPYYFTVETMQQMLWRAGFAILAPINMAHHHVGFLAMPVKRV